MVSATNVQRRGDGAPGMAWLSQAAWSPGLWQALAVAGLVLVFVGLGIDAWRHESADAREESLLNMSNPGHAIAAAGLALALAGVLGSLSVFAARHAESSRRPLAVLASAGAAWVLAIGAVAGAVTYIAASGTTVGDSHAPAAMESGASSGGQHSHEAGIHDYGPHATYTEFMRLDDAALLRAVPQGTLAAEDLPTLRTQLRAASTAAGRFRTIEQAEAAGYSLTTTDVDYMGMHYLSIENVTDGVFDPARPEGLLFSRINGAEPTLVGVWYLQAPGVGDVSRDVAPEGFAGGLDYWHGHQNVCLPFETEGVSEAECSGQGGRFLADTRWMMHAWVVPSNMENRDGVFAYMNNDLYAEQVAFHGGAPDSDGDGLEDILELRFRQNPIVADTDGDGIPDGLDSEWMEAAAERLTGATAQVSEP